MEAMVLRPRGAPSIAVGSKRRTEKKMKQKVEAAMARPREAAGVERAATEYKDGWLSRLAIRRLSRCVQAVSGIKNREEGYDGLMVAASAVWHNFGIKEQHEVVVEALGRAIPGRITCLIRTVLPPSKFTREFFAYFTTFFFCWLVGRSEVRESQIDGKVERNVVHIRKCRFLEGSNCAGMCINLCKVPSQEFLKESFGVPVNMVPNFEDMSCEMIFGEEPPAAETDPAMKQPCYSFSKRVLSLLGEILALAAGGHFVGACLAMVTLSEQGWNSIMLEWALRNYSPANEVRTYTSLCLHAGNSKRQHSGECSSI